jgi:hypothetical protein
MTFSKKIINNQYSMINGQVQKAFGQQVMMFHPNRNSAPRYPGIPASKGFYHEKPDEITIETSGHFSWGRYWFLCLIEVNFKA